jgi:sigma-E factor negative regulatory protein RseC
MSSSVIKHKGIVSSIAKNLIQVTIVNASACSGCHAKGGCSAADMQEKIIDARPNGKSYQIGEEVMLTSNEGTGFTALALGYVIPFLLVLIALIIGTAFGLKETIAGLISIGVMVPYYAVLYLQRDKMKKKFTFDIE